MPRDLLWTKLERLGVHGFFLDGIKALYADVPMVVKTAHGQTASFQSVMGVKQGCPLSPTLFGLYLDDLEEAMRAKQHLLDSPSLAGLMLLALLYADDLALVSTSMAGLQARECCYIVCLRSALTYPDTPKGRGSCTLKCSSCSWVASGSPRSSLGSHLGRRTPASHTRSKGGGLA